VWHPAPRAVEAGLRDDARVESASCFVRLATVDDGPAIGEAHAAAWQTGFEHMLDSEFLHRAVTGRREGWPFAIPHLLSLSNVVLVAGYEDRVLAFSNSGPPDDGTTVEIFAFYCHPDVWGTGLADSLMDETCSVLSTAAGHAVLWTPEHAHRAHHFYERTGFRLTGRTRTEELSDWGTSPTFAEVPAVEYQRELSPKTAVP
jgi:GNAT superfamily N-acetyltransferase